MKKTKLLAMVLLGLALALPGAAFQQAQNETTSKLLIQIGNGVLSLVVYDKDQKEISRGSAVVLSETTAVTTYHLISGAAKVTAFNMKKKEVDIDGVLAVDKTLDLALLQIDGKVKAVPLGGAVLAADMKIFAIGANDEGDLSEAEGKIRRIFDLAPNVKIADSTLAGADPFDGGAVLDESGKLSGLLNQSDKRLRFIVPTGALSALVKGKLTPFKSWTPEDFFATVEASWISGRILSWMDEYYAAQKGLERVTKAQPSNLEAWNLLAAIYDRQRDYSSAIVAFQKVVDLDPKNAAAFAGLGQIQARMQKHTEAVQNLEKALQLDSSNTVSYKFLGNAYEGLRDWVKAGDAYDKYLAAKPMDAAQIYSMLGNSRREAQQYEAAAAAYGENAKINPTEASPVFQMSQMLEKAKKYEEAEAAYIKTGELAKDPTKYFGNIITMYDQANLPEKAIAASKKSIELNPKNEQAYYNLGIFYQKMQKYPEAIAAFQQAVAVKPNYDYAWFQIGDCYYRLKNYKDAIPAFKKNVEFVPDHIYGWMYIGMSQMQLKQFATALEAMKKAVDLQPDNTDALFNLGIIYLNLKDKGSAQDIVKRIQLIDAAKAAKLKSYIK